MAIMWDIFLRYLGQNAVCLFLASKGYDLPSHYCWVDPFLPLWPHHSPIPLTICCDIPLPYTYNWSELPEVVARLMECREFLQQNALFLQTVAILWVRRVKETHYLLPRDTAACKQMHTISALALLAWYSWFYYISSGLSRHGRVCSVGPKYLDIIVSQQYFWNLPLSWATILRMYLISTLDGIKTRQGSNAPHTQLTAVEERQQYPN